MDFINPENHNVRRMHTAVKLNEAIVAKKTDAKLVYQSARTSQNCLEGQRLLNGILGSFDRRFENEF